MNGFEQAMTGGAAAPGSQQQPQGMDPGQAARHGKEASPEMQMIYNRFVGACMLAIWDEKFMPKAVEVFKGHPNQTDALASVAAGVVQRVYVASQKKGVPIPLEVMLHGGIEIVQQVADLATAGGIQGIEPDEIETAYYLAVDKVKEALTASGQLDATASEEEIQQLRSTAGEQAFENVGRRMQGAQQKTIDGLMARGAGNGGAA